LLAAALLLLAVGIWFFSHSMTRKPATVPAIAAEKRIAILPFKPLLPENRDQVLELGMADTLIAKLSNSRELVVSSLNSVRKFDGLEQDSVAAGRELQVSSVLEGNVQRAGDRIRVTARLIKIADGTSLWSGTYEDKFTDVFAVQDTIAQKVADALALRLNADENKRLTRRYTDNVEAYQLYLTGRYHWAKLTPPEVRKSIEFFNRAIDLDPTYALAYFGLADAYRALAPSSDVPPKDTLPKAKAAATKAIELDESLAEPHVSLSFIHSWLDWDWAGAEREARRAIELNPNLGFAHLAYAQVLSHVGRHQEAIAEAARARELDPLSLYINALNGQYLISAGRYDEAIAKLKQTLELDPNFWIAHFMLGTAYVEKRLYPEALAEFNEATELSKGNAEAIMMTGYTWAMAGEPAKARAVLAQLKALTDQHVPAEHIAMLCSVLGEKDEAFTWLEKACENREVRLCRLKVDPRWNSLRSDPRFVAILKRIGLQ
jgi:TolB-like protein/Flp pilus assembly protein TadD